MAPTRFQRDLFPAGLRERIEVIHDGIDTDALRPDPGVSIRVSPDGPALDRSTPVVTYVTRNIEPMRGSHIVIRSLPEILALDPRLHVIVLGGSGASYRAAALRRAELVPNLQGRGWPTGGLGPGAFRRAGALHAIRARAPVSSAVHLYMTYPFVLSWSMIEAMSLECRLVANDVAPVLEVAQDGVNVPAVSDLRPGGPPRRGPRNPRGTGRNPTRLAKEARRFAVETTISGASACRGGGRFSASRPRPDASENGYA